MTRPNRAKEPPLLLSTAKETPEGGLPMTRQSGDKPISATVSRYPVPLERFVPRKDLDGSEGHYRADKEHCLIDADNDLQAVRTWLSEFEGKSPHTARTYRKEAERLLAWSVLVRQKAMSSLNREDFTAYDAFMADPKPVSFWCSPHTDRENQKWRPFKGPLSPRSRAQALTIIKALFSYLHHAGYLSGNPLALQRLRDPVGQQPHDKDKPLTREELGAPPGTIERYLDRQTWDYLFSYIESLPMETDRQRARAERARYLFSLLYLLGPRVHEIAQGSMGHIFERGGSWWWRIRGKGRKVADVPVNSTMMKALIRYRRFLGLPDFPDLEETTSLVLTLKGHHGVTNTTTIYRIVKDTMTRAADAVEAENKTVAHTLRRASTHWLRHTAITHQAQAGVGLPYLNKLARHSNMETTGIYLHVENQDWVAEVEKHTLTRRASEGEDGTESLVDETESTEGPSTGQNRSRRR